MDETTVQLILNTLNQINKKQDTQAAQLTQISERLAAIETKQAAQDKINEEVQTLQELKDQGMGAKNVLAWIVSIGFSLIALLSKWI